MRSWSRDPRTDQPAWLRDLRTWRRERLIRMGYDDSYYRKPELEWTQHDFIQPQMMVEDRFFYNPATRQYTVNRYLDDVTKRYGGIDSVLIWPVYPNIGIDDRNQWDLLRDLPGGMPALKEVVRQFHARGVKVLLPAMPWDTGTRDVGRAYWDETAEVLAAIGADGINGDTFAGVPRAYAEAAEKVRHPLLLEPELAPQADEALIWNQQSWAYWKYGFVPTVSTLKWLETRHLPIVCDRWSRDKTDDLQFAFFNGAGYSSWENVWGIWNGLTDRDAEALRRMAFLERHFASLLTSREWEPHTPTLQYGVYASKWPQGQNTLWTVVNRNEFDVKGQQLTVAYQSGDRYYDLWHGTEISAATEKDRAVLSFDLETHGFGAVLAVPAQGSAPEALPSILQTMHTASAKPLAEFSHQWHVLTQSVVPIAETRHGATARADMVRIPAGDFEFAVHGIEIEGGDSNGVDVQYAWEDSPRRQHRRRMQIRSFFLDRYPVTKAQFAKFLDETNYRPADDHNFLRDWQGGRPSPGSEREPVTWVSLDDARAYAKWAGARLPHEWEWQYAAQGTDGRTYPWGNEWKDSAVPKRETGRTLTSPSLVGSHPEGASAFGVEDLVGNVWQWTDEYQDEHTRAAVLRGGSYYQPGGAIWYFPQAYRLDEHGKYLLMAPAKDRSGTVGFRCARDAE